MIDKTAYSFDYTTGNIISSREDEGARSAREVWAEEEAKANEKGVELFNKSSFKNTFKKHFEVSGIGAMRWTYSSCSLKGETWKADLTPKRKLLHTATVNVVFPVIEGKRLEVSMTPADILGALKTAFEHPFVSKRFEDGEATGIRLRTQGDRLHWDTPELIEILTKITGSEPKDNELGHWGYLIIDAKGEPRFTSVYLNVKTKELIYQDKSKWPYEPILVDANGNQMMK